MSASENIKVGIVGGPPLSKRLIDAVLQHAGMTVAGVLGSEATQRFAAQRRVEVAESFAALRLRSDLILQIEEDGVHIAYQRQSGGLGDEGGRTASVPEAAKRYVPPAEVIAVLRIVKALESKCEYQRLLATVVREAARQPDFRPDSFAGLRPLSDAATLEHPLREMLGSVMPEAHIRIVAAPITHANLLMMRFSLRAPVAPEDVVSDLEASPRILLGGAGEGFRSTADVVEYFRDLPRPRGDQWELFVWRESILSVGQDLSLMASFSHEAILIPEVLDLIRHSRLPDGESCRFGETTDRELGMLGDSRESAGG